MRHIEGGRIGTAGALIQAEVHGGPRMWVHSSLLSSVPAWVVRYNQEADFNNVSTGKEEMGWAVEHTVDGLALRFQ